MKTGQSKMQNDIIHGRAAQLIKKYTSAAEARRLAAAALAEDIGPGDLASCIFPPKARGRAYLSAKSDGVLSGTALADAAFRQAGSGVRVQWQAANGDPVTAGQTIATMEGPMATLLLGERVALNFLQQMSGIATLTRQFVEIARGGKYRPGIFDTRKTTPLLRAWQKQAVLHGGGKSHRFALYDMAMLKDNHIDAAGGITQAVEMLAENGFFKRRPRPGLCIEVRNTDEALEATQSRADIIMLDNMTPAGIRAAANAVNAEAARLERDVPELEISGGITLKNLGKYADLPVQRISVGALTHSAPALDISMRYMS
jgi:nicotinate-nucleotide pyrophosphorylase (carboxylating)